LKPDHFAILPDGPSVKAPEFPGLRLLEFRGQSGRRRLVANPDAHRYDPDSDQLFAAVKRPVMINQSPSWAHCGHGRGMAGLWGSRQVRRL